jgi:hypothetical protein
MTASSLTAPHRRLRRALVPAVALVLAGSATACAQKASSDAGFDVKTDATTPASKDGTTPDFEATADYLGQAVARSEGQAYRYEEGLTLDVLGEHAAVDRLITGERKGRQTALTMDVGALYKSLPAMPHLDGDLTMNVVTDGKTMYIRAPVFAALAEQTGSSTGGALGPMKVFADLGDKWGRVDLGSLGEDKALGRVLKDTGVQGSDPGAVLDVVKHADDPHDLGTDTIRGDTVHGLGATLTFEKLIEGEGLDFDDYLGSLGSSIPAAGQEVLDTIRNQPMPVEVWVDDDAHVRRMVLDIDMSKLLGGATGGEGGLEVKTTVDLYDYGSPSIAIHVPSSSVDVTDEYVGNLTG